MSQSAVEAILQQIVQLPPADQLRLEELWSLQRGLPQGKKVTMDQQVAPLPLPDYRPAQRWLVEHAHDYAGQWVALDGERLIAHGTDARLIYAAARQDGAYLPLITQVEDPNLLPVVEGWQ